MLATGKRQQRLGDLAAWTLVGVARGMPVRRRHPVLAAILAGLVIFGLSIRVTSGQAAHGTSAPASQACHHVSFRHPAGWREHQVQARVSTGNQLCETGLFIGSSDGIVISGHPLPGRATAANLATLTPFFTRGVQRASHQDGGVLQAGPQRISIGGLPALEFRASGRSYDGARTVSTLVFVFDGRTEYEVNCQHTPEHAAQVTLACNQVLRSFKVSKAT